MFKTKLIISVSIFISFLIITSVVKNETRIIEKKILHLNKKILFKKKNINEAQLDFYYLSSPAEVEKKLQIIGLDIYQPIKYSNIFFDINDLTNIQSKISNLKILDEKKKQKK